MKNIQKGWKDVMGFLYDGAPTHISAQYSVTEKLLKLEVKGGNFTEWPTKKCSAFIKTTGSVKEYSIRDGEVSKICLDAKDVVKTKTNSEGNSDKDEFAVFIVGIRLKESTDYLPVSIDQKHLPMRKFAEHLAKFYGVDLIDDSGEKRVIRKLEDLDKPIWETMSEPKSIPKVSGINYGKWNSSWKIEWHDKFKFSKDSKGLSYKSNLFVIVIICAILSWLFIPDFGAGAIVTCIFAVLAILYAPVKSHEIVIDSKGMTYTESGLFDNYKESHNLETIEQISVLYSVKDDYNEDYTLSFISDTKSIDYPGSIEILKKLKVITECACFDIHKKLNCRVPVYKESIFLKFLRNSFNIAVIGTAVVGILCLFYSLFFLAPSQNISLKRSKTDRTKWSGSKTVNLLNKAYQGRIEFVISNNWGAEGDVDFNFKVKNKGDEKVVFEMDREYFIAEWNNESYISDIKHVGFGFTPPLKGDYIVEVKADVAKGNNESLYNRALRMNYKLIDYSWSTRAGFFLILLAVFLEVLKPASTQDMFNVIIRCICIALIGFMMFESYFVTKEPNFSVKSKEGGGYVYFVHSHGYRGRRPFRAWTGTRAGQAFRGSGGGK